LEKSLSRFDDRMSVLKFILPMRMAISPVLMIKMCYRSSSQNAACSGDSMLIRQRKFHGALDKMKKYSSTAFETKGTLNFSPCCK
jgi:hypothetical protein